MDSRQLSRPNTAQTSRPTIGSNASSATLRCPIGSKIRDKRLPDTDSVDHTQRFLLECDLEEILTIDVIKEKLEERCVIDELEKRGFDLEEQILGVQHNSKRIKILAILVLIEEPAYITNFIDHGIWDKELPLDSGRCAEFFTHWKEGHVDHFCQTQHSVLAPILDFTKTEGHYRFDQNTRMPFLDPLIWSEGGANGVVSVVRIHDQHQKWGSRSVRTPQI